MLPFPEFRKQIDAWRVSRQWKLITLSARKRIAAKGLVDLGINSFWHYMEKDWFERAKRVGALKQDMNGNWIPTVREYYEMQSVGKHGRDELIEKKKKVVFTHEWDGFYELYANHLKQEAAIEKNMAALIDTEEWKKDL